VIDFIVVMGAYIDDCILNHTIFLQ